MKNLPAKICNSCTCGFIDNCVALQTAVSMKHVTAATAIVFLRLDIAAMIYFAARSVWLLFEGGVYFFGKPGDINGGWIRYIRVRQ